MSTCLGFHVECGTLLKGAGVTIMGLILFVGSVYVLLSAVFGRWMGYLVMMVAFSGWMILLSSMWYFGFYAQGPDHQDELGPRGLEPAWVPLEGGWRSPISATRRSRDIRTLRGNRPPTRRIRPSCPCRAS